MLKTHKVEGFTLVEMMLVAVLLGIVGLAIGSTFAGGLRIFNRMESYTADKADVLLFVERMERDLRNTFSFKGIDFVGESKRVTFPVILRTFSDKNRVEESPGLVSYYRDDTRTERVFLREEKTYPHAVKKESPEHGDITVLAPIEDISFQYFSYDPQTDTYGWADLWDKPKAREKQKGEGSAQKGVEALEDRFADIPLGVKIKVNYMDGDKILTLSRTVFIKTAVALNSAQRRVRSEQKNPKGAESEQ